MKHVILGAGPAGVIAAETIRKHAPKAKLIWATITPIRTSKDLAVIAEGVETQAQWGFLADAGCLSYQGYFFSRPLPVAGFEAFVSNNRQPQTN